MRILRKQTTWRKKKNLFFYAGNNTSPAESFFFFSCSAVWVIRVVEGWVSMQRIVIGEWDTRGRGENEWMAGEWGARRRDKDEWWHREREAKGRMKEGWRRRKNNTPDQRGEREKREIVNWEWQIGYGDQYCQLRVPVLREEPIQTRVRGSSSSNASTIIKSLVPLLSHY